MEIKSGQRLGKTAQQMQKMEVAMTDGPIGYTIFYDRMLLSMIKFTKTLQGVSAQTEELAVSGGSIMDCLQRLMNMEDAIQTIVVKVRIYALKNGRFTAHVWSKDVAEVKNLVEVFGGNYYRHGSGLAWVCSKRSDLLHIWHVCHDYDYDSRLAPLEVIV